MDNLAAHEERKMWIKIKSLLLSAGAGTHSDLIKAIGSALNRIISQGAIGYFASCVYFFI